VRPRGTRWSGPCRGRACGTWIGVQRARRRARPDRPECHLHRGCDGRHLVSTVADVSDAPPPPRRFSRGSFGGSTGPAAVDPGSHPQRCPGLFASPQVEAAIKTDASASARPPRGPPPAIRPCERSGDGRRARPGRARLRARDRTQDGHAWDGVRDRSQAYLASSATWAESKYSSRWVILPSFTSQTMQAGISTRTPSCFRVPCRTC